MERITLGNGSGDLTVSAFSLGNMTWGNQTPMDDGLSQIDAALDAGIDLIDTAEMYPTNPVRAETAGASERVIGEWLRRGGNRDRIVIATKVTGPGQRAVRDGAGFDGATVRAAVEDSLLRLNTDRIDLYQLHWPMRGSYHFRQTWTYDPSRQDRDATLAHMDDVLGAVADLAAAGKIRAFGLSNETCWGTTRWIDRAAATGAPRVVAVQNEYSLLCRLYDTDMAEMAVNEEVVCLAYSPLAAGILTGKYAGGAVPKASRGDLNPGLSGRMTARALAATDAYHALARTHGLDPVQMALAWLRTRPFPVIPILGATTLEQLQAQLPATRLTLPQEVLAGIEAIHRAHPLPY
jgi:aryl-alcohol dehydrogenase-like predicted oxidoreductase